MCGKFVDCKSIYLFFFSETSIKMAMVSEFLKQAWFIDNQEQEYLVSHVTIT